MLCVFDVVPIAVRCVGESLVTANTGSSDTQNREDLLSVESSQTVSVRVTSHVRVPSLFWSSHGTFPSLP